MLDFSWTQLSDTDMALHFESPHYAVLKGADGHYMITLTGIAKCGDNDFIGQNSQNWTDKSLGLTLKFPLACPPNQHFHIETFAPFMTISGIEKGGDNHNGGWAINNFDFGLPGGTLNIYDQVTIRCTVRARGSLFSVFRIGYMVTICGYLEQNK